MALENQNSEESKNNTQLTIKYKYPSWSTEYITPMGTLILGLIILFLPIVLATLSGRIWGIFAPDWGAIKALLIPALFSIFLFAIAAFTWPYIPCTIQILSNSIVFNQKSRTRIYKPKRRLLYSEIGLCKYLQDTKELTIITKSRQTMSINLHGANTNDIENLIEALRGKGINVVRK